MTQWQVLGITADPGVLEVNLPVCHTWQDYADWMHCLEQAATRVGLRSWRFRSNRQESTGGGNHLLLGGPSLDDNPFFSRPAWLVGLLRYWQHHPSLAYLFNGRSVGPASQSPRPDEGSANRLDLQLALHTLERLPTGAATPIAVKSVSTNSGIQPGLLVAKACWNSGPLKRCLITTGVRRWRCCSEPWLFVCSNPIRGPLTFTPGENRSMTGPCSPANSGVIWKRCWPII